MALGARDSVEVDGDKLAWSPELVAAAESDMVTRCVAMLVSREVAWGDIDNRG